MARYTLTPESTHGVPRKEIIKQFLFFLKTMKQRSVLETSPLADLPGEIKLRKRWGSLEGGTLALTAQRHPDRLGLVDDEGELTYAEFFDHVYRLAHGLQNYGVKDGDNVAVMALNGRAAIFPLSARQLLGYHIFMVNANSSGPQIHKVLEYHEINAFIVDQEFYDRLLPETKEKFNIIIGHTEGDVPDGLPTLNQIIDETHLITNEDRLPEKPTKSVHVVMTSGTTGMPKGVVRRQLVSPQGIAPAFAAIPWRQDMTVMLHGVLFHFYGWANMLIAMLTGSTIITRRHFDVDETLDIFDKYKVNAWVSAASRLRSIIAELDDRGVKHVDGLEFICSSGSPLTEYEVTRVVDIFGPILCNSYGSTETAGLAISPPELLAKDTSLTGRIHPGYLIEIRDDEGNLLPDGEIGEIYAGCYDMFVGYTDPDAPVRVVNKLLRMGDRGYKKGDLLYVLGRADDLVITQFGEKIFPSELEDLLIRDPRVEDAHVHGVKDAKFGQALRAYIIRAEGVSAEDLSEEEVRRIIVEELSAAHAPRDVFFMKDFPRNPMGKVIRPELPDHSTA
ncbi:AMP-binding protein [Corynebacterium lowii]|uniref:Putative sulfoacetate--CoA ligase n=1 Tax=Corynebacterium lowii TaxID=1544413 RepID=A0A0Q1AHD2_9CORY|nr:AMP-binding protein [Corynebacterium lowii]KQB86081.1 putative sulfoacetate--CoA ligase [Corynebacterium lowii]MDP9852553.1 fatty-acyl-CoA synthase [Corynebacterium lowii]